MEVDKQFDSAAGPSLDRGLAKRMKSRTDLEVLAFLGGHSDDWFEDIEIHRHTQSSPREVYASLYALADSGLVKRLSQGIQVFYGLTDNAALRASVMKLTASQGEGLAEPKRGAINERK
jgi:DNA-binding transcriptional ArsR family regulator